MNKFCKGIIIIILSIVIVFILYSLRDSVSTFSELGYVGVFIISFISSGTIIFPVPGWAVVIGMATVLNPVILGICAGTGSALGELTGYFLGMGGNYIMDKRTKTLQTLMQKHGTIILFVLAFIPNPFFDVAGIIAGASKIRIHNFMIPVIAGKVIRYIILCYMTLWGINILGLGL